MLIFTAFADTSITDSIYYSIKDIYGAQSNIAKIVVEVKTDVIKIPEAFTPNDDGIHDQFEIYNPAGHSLHLQIFNRWGEKVFEQKNYQNQFRGVCNQPGVLYGKSLPDGTYLATIEIEKIDGTKSKMIKDVLILR